MVQLAQLTIYCNYIKIYTIVHQLKYGQKKRMNETQLVQVTYARIKIPDPFKFVV